MSAARCGCGRFCRRELWICDDSHYPYACNRYCGYVCRRCMSPADLMTVSPERAR